MSNARRIYKILDHGDWALAQAKGRYDGSAVDRRDGFIHFSTAEQVVDTARKHFAGRDNLVLVGFDATALGAALCWEPSRGGALFPHLYAPLDPAMAVYEAPVRRDESGAHVFGALE